LTNHGLAYVWINQFDIDFSFVIIRQRIIDPFLQIWYTDINNSSRLQTYSIFKHDFKCEKFFYLITGKNHRIALTKFRTSSHSLCVESGRYENIPRSERICKSCLMRQPETDYNFLLVANFIQFNSISLLH
jgi:hypothetical protein